MQVVETYVSTSGNKMMLKTDGTRWEVTNCAADGAVVWTETSVSGVHPFTEEEARAEFERWRV
jgi:hypothetical protein